MHAHFDCFSGAAGDMMLAATLDAADFLPYPILQSSTDNDDDGNNTIKNSDKLLSRITKDLECGLPELSGEFKLSVKRVWRSSGRIAAKKVDVHSIYNHEAAPVPGANKDESKEEEDAHSHTHQHAHQHAHQNAHQHTHQHTHDHQHSSSSTSNDDATIKEHTHDHQHSISTSNDDDDGMKEDPQSKSHSHNHGHSHGHKHSHSHGHDHDSKLRNLPQITKMLQSAPTQHIPKHVAALAIKAFTALAHAEMHTHGAESIDEVHFHEVGAVDSIVDTVGTLLALFHLGVDLCDNDNQVAVSCSPLPLGEGTVWTDHGLLPVPAPATMRLMVGMPTCPGPKGVTGELVTPTAAALLRTLTGVSQREGAEHSTYWQSKRILGRPPNMIPRSVGIGAGSKDFERHPNIMRLILGDTVSDQSQSSNVDDISGGEILQNESKISLESNTDTQKVSEGIDVSETIVNKMSINDKRNEEEKQLWNTDTLTHMQANIDDATPELMAHALELLLKDGALDAWICPIIMKKGRPAYSLHCLCRCDTDNTAEHRLLNIMFRHTTTLGIRIQRNILRAALQRRFVKVQTPFSTKRIDVKISSLNNGEVVSVKAEFEQCKLVSEESCTPLKTVSSAAERIAYDNPLR